MALPVGLPIILENPAVNPAPNSVNRRIPVPSVYRDGRGEIHNLAVNEERYNLLHTKKGMMRSGDIHDSTQHDFVLSGKVRVWQLQADGSTETQEVGANAYVNIPPYTPHIFEFLEDTSMMEWWDGPFYAWFYEPYRRQVEASFQRTQPGKLELLRGETSQNGNMMSYLWTGLALGLTLGWFIGRERACAKSFERF